MVITSRIWALIGQCTHRACNWSVWKDLEPRKDWINFWGDWSKHKRSCKCLQNFIFLYTLCLRSEGSTVYIKKKAEEIFSLMTLITIDLNLVFRVLKIHNTLHWLSKIQHSYRSPTIYLTLDIDAKKVIVFSSPSNHKCKYRIEKGIYWTINVVLKFYKCFKHSYH